MLRRLLTQKSSYVARCSVGMWQQLEVTCVGQLNRVQLGTGPHAALATTAGAAIGKRIAREKKGPLAKAFNEQLAAIPKFHGVIGSALLERLPVVMPEPEQWQVDYAAWKEQRDRMKTKDTSEYLEQILSENRPTIRSEEDEEMSRAEKLYEPAPRETEADIRNDKKSLHRKLDQRLFFVVKEKGNKQWGFLAAEHEAGEPLRRTAERAVKAANASEKHVYFVGNVPCAYWPKEESLREARYKEVRTHEEQQLMSRHQRLEKQREVQAIGSHHDTSEGHVHGHFFFRAQLISNSWDVDTDKFDDYAWVTTSELRDYLDDSRLAHTLKYFIDESLCQE